MVKAGNKPCAATWKIFFASKSCSQSREEKDEPFPYAAFASRRDQSGSTVFNRGASPKRLSTNPPTSRPQLRTKAYLSKSLVIRAVRSSCMAFIAQSGNHAFSMIEGSRPIASITRVNIRRQLVRHNSSVETTRLWVISRVEHLWHALRRDRVSASSIPSSIFARASMEGLGLPAFLMSTSRYSNTWPDFRSGQSPSSNQLLIICGPIWHCKMPLQGWLSSSSR